MNCILFNAPPEKFTPIWRCYYWRWRAAIFRLKLGNKAGRELYRSLQETLIEYWETVFQITANLKWVGIYRCKAILVTRKTHWHYRAAFKLCHVETIREGLQKYKTRIYKFFFSFSFIFLKIICMHQEKPNLPLFWVEQRIKIDDIAVYRVDSNLYRLTRGILHGGTELNTIHLTDRKSRF